MEKGNFKESSVINLERLKKELKNSSIDTDKICNTLFTHFPECILIIDKSGKVKYMNENTSKYYPVGYKSIFDIPDTFLHERYKKAIKKIFESGNTHSEEIFLKYPDSDELWFNTDFIPLKDNNDVILILIIAKNITEQKKTLDALRESESQFRMLSEFSGMGISIIQNDVFKYLNKTFAEIFEYTADEIINMKENCMNNIIHPEDSRIVIKHINKKYHDKKHEIVLNCKWRGITKNKKEKWIESFLRTIYFKGKPAVIITIVDITEKVKNDEQFHQKNKMEAIGELAGGIAHDFNNMLAGIMGFAEILAYKIKDEKLRSYSDNIVKTAVRASELTRQLLAFARKGYKQFEEIEINELVSDLIKFLKRSLDKNIVIKKQLNAESSIMTGDPVQIQNALLNLSINARDAMPEGGKLVFSTDIIKINDDELSKEYSEKIRKGEYIKISVKDTGRGMSEETKKRIFEPFFSTKSGKRGTGMGLAAVYGIVKSHSGYIAVQSEPEKGSVFSILFRLAEHKVPNFYNELNNSPRIMIIDDEPVILKMLSVMLENFGHEIKVFDNGTDALKYYEKAWRNIDLVILDMEMPGMKGREVFFELQKINPNVKVLISSGYSIEEDAKTLINEGALGLLQKPYRKDELLDIINDIKNMDN